MKCQKQIPLRPLFVAFDAEIAAAFDALEIAIDLPIRRFVSNVWVLLDNFGVAWQLIPNPTYSFQGAFTSFASRSREWPYRTRLPHTQAGEVRAH